jgi:DNA-binding PadR family transcriptional regulator
MPKRSRGLGYGTVAILQAIQAGHRYGLDMMEATGLPSGAVYPALARLERRGLVEARWESDRVARREARPRRRYYRITAEGKRAAAEAVRRFATLGLTGSVRAATEDA